MQVYIGGPLRIKKFRNLKLYESIANIIYEMGFEPYIPHIETAEPDKEVEENRLYKNNIIALHSSSFAIFDVTNPSHGVGMEIQHALLNKIPFFCIAEKGATISKMIKGSIEPRKLIRYSNIEELKIKLKRMISQEICLTNELKSGKFITIEGIDFTGKSTICKRLEKELRKTKQDVVIISDPPLIHPWQDLKQFFEKQQEISNLSEAILLVSSRLDNYERVINPYLRRGAIVISDRYIDSWFAYQSYRLRSYFHNNIEDTLDFLICVNNFFLRYSFLSLPDLTILIIDDPEETLKRAKFRNRISKYEKLETQEIVQNIYLKIAKKFESRFKVIDAKSKDIDTVFKEIYCLIEKCIEGE
ncbi:dTMP kinase [Methanophagales archaeon]|nr:MAG: dTMP kinase [Methanophagales archaeon]